MRAALPTGALDLRADDDAVDWLLTLDPTVLAVLGGLVLVLLLVGVVTGWVVVRRVRRSPLAARGRELASRGRELGVQGATAVAARRLPPGERRTAAELQLAVGRARAGVRHEVAAARANGAHLGDVPDLLPALEAEGDRLEQRLRQRALVAGPADGGALADAARAYLDTLADVCDAVGEAGRVARAGRPAPDVGDAVTALRAHTAAYRELTTPPGPPPLPSPAPPGREATRG